MSGFAAMSGLNIAISGLRQTQRKGVVGRAVQSSPIFEEIYICKLIIFVWFAFRNNQSNLTTVSNICKNIFFLLCAVLNFKQRIAEKILNNLCGTSFINGLVGMPYKENSKSAFKLQ